MCVIFAASQTGVKATTVGVWLVRVQLAPVFVLANVCARVRGATKIFGEGETAEPKNRSAFNAQPGTDGAVLPICK